MLRSALQQLQDGGDARGLARDEAPCQAAIIETKSASTMDRLFWKATRICLFQESLRELKPYGRGRQSQFFSSPQAGMALPMYGFFIAFSVCSQLALAIGQ